MQMLRSFELRLKPKAAQRAAMQHILADSAETYNAALQERRDAWKHCQKAVTYFDQQAELTELRKDPQFTVIAVDIQREPLRRVDRAFKAFFRRVNAGQKPGYPRFRSRDRYDSFAWHAPRLHPDGLLVPNLGHIRFKANRAPSGVPKMATIVRCGKKWTARIVCDIGPAPEKRTVTSAVGMDVGLTTLVTLSDGTEIENPRWTRQHEDRIARANRVLARKQKRSKNRTRAREALHRAHQRAANARKNYLHHVSKWLVGNYDLIAHEALNVNGMAQGNLAKSILDAAWSILLFQLRYKAESAGVHVIAVNPRGTSQLCSGCGRNVPKKLSERTHDCPHCGLILGRDENAGRNLLALGISAAGLEPSKCIR
jgi:putative transposase